MFAGLRLMACLAVLHFVVGVGSVRADDGQADALSERARAETKAEIDRLSDEIRTLARRQVWSGVERKYSQVVQLQGEVPAEIHLTGAYSAREEGDLLEVYDRLIRAASGSADPAVVDWLWDLDHNYGRVTLIADRRRTAELTAGEMPLDPNRRVAVQAAIETCANEGKFNGLLPKGHYEFVGQKFKVDPGVGVRVEVSPKMRRRGLVEPTIVYQELPTAVGQ